MTGRPKLFRFDTWAKPSSAHGTNGNKLRSLSEPDAHEHRTRVRVAQFFVLTALLFVLADYLGRVQDHTGANLVPDSTSQVQLSLSPPQRSGNGSGFTVRFRLSNKGNQSVFYPTGSTAKVPLGQLVARAPSTSDWMGLSASSKQLVPPVGGFGDSKLDWIEMPPGGWVNGDFQDSGESPGEHAYAIYVRISREGNGIWIVSRPYSALVNQ